MRRYEKQKREVTTLVRLTCDLCGAVANGGYWPIGSCDVNEVEVEVTVRQKEGKVYFAGEGYGTEYIVDLCPACFKTRLIPWLKSQGANIEQQEWES